MNNNTHPVSAFVICLNEESQIRRCLESIKWCQEIIVIDSGSTDRTLEICKEFTDKILHRDWSGYVDQKKYGLEKCTCEWVLNIDADEVVSEELKNEIIELVNKDAIQRLPYNGFHISRVVNYLGRWWRNGGWYPEYRLRLCRKSATTWGGTDPHEKASVEGETRKLTGELFHYTYKDIQDQVTRLNKFASSAAKSMISSGKPPSILQMIFRPIFRFVKFYIVKKGFKDGVAGFIIAILEAYYVFLKYAKVWEAKNSKQS